MEQFMNDRPKEWKRNNINKISSNILIYHKPMVLTSATGFDCVPPRVHIFCGFLLRFIQDSYLKCAQQESEHGDG